MKVLVVGDVHFCSYSSILRTKGEIFSKRLENCVASINYVEKFAEDSGCSYIIYLGDFFDKDTLNGEELTALQSISWSSIRKIVLVGNHEMSSSDLSKSSAHILNLIPNATVIDTPNALVGYGYRFIFLPYILEEKRCPLNTYISYLFSGMFETSEVKNTYIFSHNDIKGIQMGKFTSEEGFTIEELSSNCTYCFNGHIHNGARVSENVLNVGNITGQNFSEDASLYSHHFVVLDTDSNKIEFHNNPEAFNFLKFEIKTDDDFKNFRSFVSNYHNVVITIKCSEPLCDAVKEFLRGCTNIVEYRITTVLSNPVNTTFVGSNNYSINYIDEFSSYVLDTMGRSDVVNVELQKVFT